MFLTTSRTFEFHEKDYDKILSVISKEKESSKLDKFVTAQGNVEDWLNNLLKLSHRSVHIIICQAFYAIADSSEFHIIICQAFYAIADSSEFHIMDCLNNFPAQLSV